MALIERECTAATRDAAFAAFATRASAMTS